MSLHIFFFRFIVSLCVPALASHSRCGSLHHLAHARHPAARRSCTCIRPFVTAWHLVRPSTRHPVRAQRHPAARRSRASRPFVTAGHPANAGIQPLVAAVHQTVCHSQVCLASLWPILLVSIRWYTWICICAPPVDTPSTMLVSFPGYRWCGAELANPSLAPPLLC